MHRNLPISLLAAALVAASTIPAGAAALPRANVVLPSAVSVDLAANTVTLPLFRGTAPGGTVWYIKTDVSDAAIARREGILFSPVLANAAAGAQTATGAADAFHFSGTVDFKPQRELKAGPDGAPAVAKPGSIGDAAYSPFVVEAGSHVVYNAPIVAAGEHPSDVTTHTDTLDRAVAINTSDAHHATITLVLARGYTAGQPIAYISTDSSDAGAATIERSTFAPRLARATSGSIPIYVLFNGRSDAQYQGVGNALAHGGLGDDATAANAEHLASPLNVQATFPAPAFGPSGYSPLWNVHAGIWTPHALAADKATRLTTPEAFEAAAAAGNLTAPNGKAFGPVGIVVNCPVIAFAAARPQ